MSRKDALDALEAQLGARPPKGLSRLSEEQIRELGGTLTQARRAQSAELRSAGDKAFNQIPWLLRGPIRKIMS